MTQEELDALMNGDVDLDGIDEEDTPAQTESASDDEHEEISDKDFRVNPSTQWPPPPPTNEHKVVHQLDEVTKETEEKSGQIFDILEVFSNGTVEIETKASETKDAIGEIIEIFEKLQNNFPNIKTFSQQIDKCRELSDNLDFILESAQNLSDQSLIAMDLMQYQDIQRQKIERVINVMRSLSKYMSSLFEGKIDDEKRVSSAVHIKGDSTTDVADEDDIEALIAAFGKK